MQIDDETLRVGNDKNWLKQMLEELEEEKKERDTGKERKKTEHIKNKWGPGQPRQILLNNL